MREAIREGTGEEQGDAVEATGQRTGMVGGLRASHEGTEQVLAGWVHRRRDLGGLIFVDLRDRSGLLQLSFGPDWTQEASMEVAHRLGGEDVIRVRGVVRLRPEEARNPELPTGDLEFQVVELERLNAARTPEIPVYRGPEDEPASEELRLRHRHLDLRRPELQQNLMLRHRLVLETRTYLDEQGFVEVETPILTKRTPEGARDYLVPSRNHPGEFYALPQSPQLYKQILMTAGMDRYFQIARCFRDEDLRADRQPEFTQIDLEASFVEPQDIHRWVEGLMERLGEQVGIPTPTPFPRLSYAEALERYGSDRPDLRVSLEIEDWTEALRGLEFGILQKAVEAGGRIRGIRVPGGGELSRKDVEALEKVAQREGAPGLLWAKRTEDGGSGPLARFMEDGDFEAVGARPGDLLLVGAGEDRITSPSLGAVRVEAAAAVGLPRASEAAWVWITDFPLFERDEDGSLAPTHHPFTQPTPEHLDRLEDDPESVGSLAYDVVYNGSELGSGSIRIHDPDVQRRVLRVLGLEEEAIESRFGFLLEALESGAPPHGGIAFGVDRIVKDFLGAPSLRDVIAFPKTTAARALYEKAPTEVLPEELAELHLRPVGDRPGPSGSGTPPPTHQDG